MTTTSLLRPSSNGLPQNRSFRRGGFSALAFILLFFSALPGFAQSVLGTLTAVQPTYLAIDTDTSGTRWLYVSQHGEVRTDGTVPTNGGVILKYNLTTGSTTAIPITTHGTGDGQFISPDGILIDPATHDLFVADRYLNRVQRLHNDGTFVMKWGSGTSGALDEMHGPSGLARDAAGAIYIAEHGDTINPPFGAGGQHVSKWVLPSTITTPPTQPTWRIGSYGGGDGQFNSTGPYGIAVSGSTVFVADAFNMRVETFDLSGNYVSQFGMGIAEPLGISLDSTGALWIAQTSNYDGSGALQQAQKYSTNGSYAGVTLTTSSPSFSLPFSAVIDAATNEAYVSDYGNSRIVVFALAGASVPVVSNATVNGSIGTAITPVQVTATNSPTSFSASGLATYGLAISSSGLITGTPTTAAAGVAVSVTATNAAGTSAAATITLNLTGTSPVVSNASVSGAVGVAIAPVQVSATNSPTSFTASGLATYGLAISSSGLITGTPTATASGATVSVTATNASGTSAPATITLNISAANTPIVTNASVTGNVGIAIAPVQVSATNSPTSFSAPGLAAYGLSISSTGLITGAPTATASSVAVNVTATNANGTSAPATITLHIGGTGPVVTSFAYVAHTLRFDIAFSEPVTGVTTNSFVFTEEGFSFGQFDSVTQVDASHYSLNFSFFSGAPGAFVFDIKTSGSGIVGVNSGLPYAGAGYTKALVPVTPHLETDAPWVKSFAPGVASGNTVVFLVQFNKESFNIQPSNVTINTTGTATAQLGYIMPADDTALTYAIPVTFSGTGTISLTLTNATQQTISDGNYNFYVGPDTSSVFTIPTGPSSAPVVSNASVSGTTGTAITPVQVVATNSPTSFNAPGLTNYGLAIDATGLITGTPATNAVNVTATVTATNASGMSAPATLTLNFSSSPPSGSPPVVSNASVSGTVGTPITSVQVAATNSPTSFNAPGLAAYGLSINSSGLITGTPTATATNATVSVTASNSAGTSAAATITLNINAAPPSGNPPVVSSATVSGTVGTPMSYQIVATNSPTSYAVASGVLPPGLTLTSTTGQITGTPSSPATNVNVGVTATNGSGTSAAATLTFNIAAAPPSGNPPVVSNATVSGTVGTGITPVQVSATNSPTSFSAPGLSTYGLAISSSGLITGTPTATATNAAVSVTANNSFGSSAAATITLNIAAAPPPSGNPPVVSNATVSGTVGTSITPVQVSATNSPTSFSAPGLSTYGLAISSGGLITGTPTATATNATVSVTASNSAGTSAAATITLNIAAAPPPPAGPTITNVAQSLAAGSYDAGTAVNVTVTFNAAVTVTGTPNLALTIGSNTRQAVCVSGSGTTALVFRYTIAAGDNGAITISGPIALNGGTIRGGSGTDATLTFSAVSTSAIADTTAPATPTVTGISPATPIAGQSFTLFGQAEANATIIITNVSNVYMVSANSTGAWSRTGFPPVPGQYPYTFAAQDAAGNTSPTSATYTVTVQPSPSTPVPVVTSSSINGSVGTNLSYQIIASNSPSDYSLAVGSTLPSGLALNTRTGVISGTPTAVFSGTVQVGAENAGGWSAPATLTFNIVAAPPPSAPPVVTNASVSGTVGTPITAVQVSATNSPTSFSAPGLTPYGLTINSSGLITGTPTMAATNATVAVTASNSVGTSASATITLNIAAAPPPTGNPPVVSNATVSGTVGTTIAAVQVSATNSPTSFNAPGLASYGLAISSSGLITGTPTAAAASVPISVTASNGSGTSAAATITLNIAAAPPPAGNPPAVINGTVYGTVGLAIAPLQISATNSPTSFSAPGLASYGLAISSTGVVTGTPTTVAANVAVSVTAANAYGTSAPGTITLILSAPQPFGGGGGGGGGSTGGGGGSTGGGGGGGGVAPTPVPVVSNASVSGTVGTPIAAVQVAATNSPTAFSAPGLASYGLSISSSGLITGTPTATAANTIIAVTASNSGGTSGAAALTLNLAPAPKAQNLTFVAPTSGLVVGQTVQLGATVDSGQSITYSLVSGPAVLSGSSLLITGSTPITVRATAAGNASFTAASQDVTFTATKAVQKIDSTLVPATVHTDGAVTLSATSTSGLPITYRVVSGPATVAGNVLTFTGSGAVTLEAVQAGNDTYASTTTTITLTGNPVPRLINISSRLKVSANDANGASIAGFVITGSAPKQILIRAVGPTLAKFGISNPLANPTLTVFDGATHPVASNSGWNDDAKISATDDAVGAFRLDAGSKDAALLLTLAPGIYTAQVSSTTNSGTALIEVYDVSAGAAVPTKQLINISTRGSVGTNDDVLVGGFYVSGNEPKKVLIRGIGPALTAFGVTGALPDPVLKIYDANGVVVAQNDNWGTALKVSATSTETPATGADIAAAAAATGAFPLDANSHDAAVVVTLAPGQYSAIVTGANGSSGAAMVEVYELPTP